MKKLKVNFISYLIMMTLTLSIMLGYVFGVCYLGVYVSRWFLLLYIPLFVAIVYGKWIESNK